MIPKPREEDGYIIIDFHKCGKEYDRYFKGIEKPVLIACVMKDGMIAYSMVCKDDIRRNINKKQLKNIKEIKIKMAKKTLNLTIKPEEFILLRCVACGKLLAKENKEGELKVEIKCPRCGTVNER